MEQIREPLVPVEQSSTGPAWPAEVTPEIDGRVGIGELLLTVPEAAAVLRVSRAKLYDLMRRGQLLSVLVGGSRRVPRAAVLRYVQELTETAERELAERRVASEATATAVDWRARWPELGLHRPA
jgi:excisionase family DNA binding protein